MESSRAETPEELSDPSFSDDRSRDRNIGNEEDGLSIEEIEEDSNNVDTSAEHLIPDHYEEVEADSPASDTSAGSDHADRGVMTGLRKLSCDDDTESQNEQEGQHWRSRKRGNTGLFKRSHSQSAGSNIDVDADALDDHDVLRSARRLRRRVRGPDEQILTSYEGDVTPVMGEVEEPASDSSGGRRPRLGITGPGGVSPTFPDSDCAMDLDSVH